MKNEKTLRDKAVEWWAYLTMMERQSILVKHNFTGAVTEEVRERLYISEHPQETQEKTPSVIEGLEDAAKSESKDYGDNMKIHIECAFTNGAKWFADTHYKPLLDELDKMKRSFYMNICRAYNAGKGNALKMVAQSKEMGEDTGVFISSHDYFIGEFPEFTTNVP